MALDTRNKRASALGMGLLALTLAPVPTGGIDQPGRQQVAGYYAGISAVALIDPSRICLVSAGVASATLASAAMTAATLDDAAMTAATLSSVEMESA